MNRFIMRLPAMEPRRHEETRRRCLRAFVPSWFRPQFSIIRLMRNASNLLVAFMVLLVCLWPPGNERSLVVRLANWAVDPRGELPVLPAPFALDAGDDPDAVAAHDAQVQAYDARYAQGGWMRRRLEWKVAR